MSAPRSLLLTLSVSALLGGGLAAAQDGREAEVQRLEALLRETEAALAALKPMVDPDLELQFHDARLHTHRPDDRWAPSLLLPAASTGFRTGAGAPAADAGGALSFDEEEESGTGVDADKLIELIESQLDEGDEEGSVEMVDGRLIVRKSARAQRRIASLLETLAGEQLRSVQLEVGFYVLPEALQDELGLAARKQRGVLTPADLARIQAAVGDGSARLARKAVLTALNGQRVFLHHGDERAYVGGYRQVSGGGEAHAVTVSVPRVEVLRTGLALDACPTVSAGEVGLDVRLVRSSLGEGQQRQTRWGAIDVPQVTVSSVRTSAQVPDGAGMLVLSMRGGAAGGADDVTVVVRPRIVPAR